MSKIIIFVLVFLIGNGVGYAQKQKAADEMTRDKVANSTESNEDKQKKGGRLDTASQVRAELMGTIDARKAKPGDEVVFRTTKAVKQNGEVVIEKGAKLYGKITEVTRRSKDAGESKIAFVMDRLEGKEISMPVTVNVLAMTNSRASASLAEPVNADITHSSTASSRTPAGTSAGGGGLLGGVGGAVNNTLGTVTGTAGNVAGSVRGTADNTLGAGIETVAGTVKGVRLSSSASGSSSTSAVLTSRNGDVKIEKGLMFDLTVQKSSENN